MLNVSKFGKLLLSAYIMDRIKKGDSHRSSGLLKKYAELSLGAYILKKLKSEKSENVETVVETKEVELDEIEEETKSSMGFGGFVMGLIAGATIIYVVNKQAAKKHGHTIAVE